MENISNAAEEVLIDSLSFKLPSSGNYITDRRSCTFHTEGSNSYSATQGTKVIRFRLAGDGWLDPSTFRIAFDVVNDDTAAGKALRPIGRAHAFFRRLRIAVRGQIIEDIDNFNRVSELFHILQSRDSRFNDGGEEFGYNADISLLNTLALLPGFTTSQTVMFKPLCGLFAQTKYLPLRFCPIEIELELADVGDPIVLGNETTLDEFTAANTSEKWKLENCMVKVDICSLDNALDNSYVSHLMSGKTMNVVFNTFISSLQTIVSADTQINVSRSLSKMKSIFLSLDKDFAGTRKNHYNKKFNNFWSPLVGNGATGVLTHNSANEIKHLQVQIGSKLFPEYPIKSHSEAFYSLRKALGIHANNLHSIDIDGNSYRNNKFIVGFDTEKLLGLSFTGMNARNSIMTAHLKTGTGDYQADRMHIVLLSEQILEIGNYGVMVFD